MCTLTIRLKKINKKNKSNNKLQLRNVDGIKERAKGGHEIVQHF